MTSLSTHPSTGDPLAGVLLGGKYRIEGVLGRGGTGNVYRAIQEPIGRPVAVKILRLDLPPDEQRQFEIRFLREASQAGALQHPNVVTVHDFGRAEDGTCFIVMELLRGRSLKEAMKAGPLPTSRALFIFDQMVRGLRAAHARGMVHRDVKPGNIFLLEGDDGRDLVKLLDFGLVKDAAGAHDDEEITSRGLPQADDDSSSESTVTRHGVFLGTPHYVAPEQATGRRVDGRADLYSAGVVLYRMLTGVLPYYDRDPAVMTQAHVSAPYPPMASRAPDVVVPPAVEALVRRCMEKNPEARWADADALLADLVQLRRQIDLEAGVIAESTTSLVQPIPPPGLLPSPAPPAGRRKGLLAAALGLLVLGLAGGAMLWPRPEAPIEIAPATLALEPVEQAPAERSVSVFLASAPSGASVSLEDGTVLGQTPLVWRRVVPEGAPAPNLRFTFSLDGHAPVTREGLLDADELVLNATLSELPRAKTPDAQRAPRPEQAAPTQTTSTSTKTEAPAPSGGAGTVYADGVPFSAAEAAATVRWLNEASEADLHGAGIAPKQVHLILGGRPWKDIGSFAAAFNIGEKTVAAARAAAGR